MRGYNETRRGCNCTQCTHLTTGQLRYYGTLVCSKEKKQTCYLQVEITVAIEQYLQMFEKKMTQGL